MVFINFIINGHNVASLTGRNTIVHSDNLCGLDLQQNDLYDVNNCVINNTIRGQNCSFVNACVCNLSVTNFYADPAIIDSCSFT